MMLKSALALARGRWPSPSRWSCLWVTAMYARVASILSLNLMSGTTPSLLGAIFPCQWQSWVHSEGGGHADDGNPLIEDVCSNFTPTDAAGGHDGHPGYPGNCRERTREK